MLSGCYLHFGAQYFTVFVVILSERSVAFVIVLIQARARMRSSSRAVM